MVNFFGKHDRDADKTENMNDGKLRLKKEELDITKNKEQAGEVTLGKEIVEEEKSVDVPVTHEEVIIERRSMEEPSDSPIEEAETMHIPVSEEHVQVGKHTVITGEISAQKHEVEETQHIEETLKREEARIDKSGNANIVSDDTEDQLE